MGSRERKGDATAGDACSTIGMPIYWPHGNWIDAGLPPVWPCVVAPLSGQDPRHLSAVLLALLESSTEGRETAEDKTTSGRQDAWPASAHQDARTTTGYGCDSFLAWIPEERRLPDPAKRLKFRLSGAAARVGRSKQHRTADRVTGETEGILWRVASAVPD